MYTEDFDFELPNDLIAQNPVKPRDASRMMVVDRNRGIIDHRKFFELPFLMKEGDVLVLNKSRVIPARILFTAVGKEKEILLIRKTGIHEWSAMVRPGKFFKQGQVFKINEKLEGAVIDVMDSGLRKIRFSSYGADCDVMTEKAGQAPLPPYIKNSSAKFDDYQTIYAKEEGSVAAPTAGLHFTEGVFKALDKKGVKTVFVTLHVGPGTFLPVKTERITDHRMHSEWYSMDVETANTLNEAIRANRRIVAVGTTSVRVLESNFREGKFWNEESETDIYIYPGYKWKCVTGLITNFHLPKSTLLMLVCSFGGKELMMNAYRQAVLERYRFFSFGDAMFIV